MIKYKSIWLNEICHVLRNIEPGHRISDTIACALTEDSE